MIVVSGKLKEQERYKVYPVIKGTMWKPLRFAELYNIVKSCLAGEYREEFFNVE